MAIVYRMKRVLRLLVIAGAVAGAVAVWYKRQQGERRGAVAEGEWSARPALKAVPDPAKNKPPAAVPDDLTDIKGIGPKYSQQLADMGITTFAALAEADAATVSAEFGGRASIEDWIAQAKELPKG